MLIGKAGMAEYQRRPRMAETLRQGCGIARAEKYHHVNPASAELRLCQNYAAALCLVREIKGQTRSRRTGALPDTLERISDAINEQPHQFCL